MVNSTAQPTGNPKRQLAHITGTKFGVGSADAPMTVTFVLGSDARGSTMVMTQNSRERMLTRIK